MYMNHQKGLWEIHNKTGWTPMKGNGDTPVKPPNNTPTDYLVMGCYHEIPGAGHAHVRPDDEQIGGDTPDMGDHG